MSVVDQQSSWYLEPGLSILVGTVDAARVPSCCRGVAIAGDASRLTVYVPMSTSQRILRDVATTRRLAVTASHVVTHRTIQFKGRTGDARIAGEAEGVLVQDWFD